MQSSQNCSVSEKTPQREHRFTASSNFGSSHNKKHGLHHDGHCDRIMPNNKKSHKARKPTRRPRNPKRKALESLTSAEASGAPAGTPQTSCPPAAALASHRARVAQNKAVVLDNYKLLSWIRESAPSLGDSKKFQASLSKEVRHQFDIEYRKPDEGDAAHRHSISDHTTSFAARPLIPNYLIHWKENLPPHADPELRLGPPLRRLLVEDYV